MDDSTFLSQFSPQWTHPDKLEKILVQREDLLAESVAKIRESILTGNKHHLLFIGPRGAGKTHLVSLIHHRLQTRELTDRVRFAWLNEDEIATTFLKLLVLIYRSLAERYPALFSRATIPGLAGMDPLTAEEKLGQTLLRELGSCTLVVLMENLDSLFRHMPDGELLRWRAFVQNHPVFATVGTAQTLFDGVSERSKPFFGFFDTQHLQPLSVQDARLLLEKIATLQGKTDLLDFLQTPTGRARVSAIHDLAGGNPRLYLIFSEFLTKVALDDLVRPFEEMVDRQLTSYYQERLRWLSPQQREIIQLLCHHGRPIPVKQIAEGLFTTHNSITGQLKPLRDMRYVNFRQNGREVLYELAEPLMRLALQVKETHNRKPLALIVDFLRVWHDRVEIEKQLVQCPLGSLGHAYFTEALTRMDSGLPNLRHQIWRDQLEGAEDGPCDDETLSQARILAEESKEVKDWIKVGMILKGRQEWNEAVKVFTHITEQENVMADKMGEALFLRGYALGEIGRAEDEIMDYTRVIELPKAPVEQVAVALFNKGVVQDKLGKNEDAMASFTDVIELFGAPVDKVAAALNSRAISQRKAGKLEEAIVDYSRVIELHGVPVFQIAQALYNRAVAYVQLGMLEEAIADCTYVIELPGAAVKQVAKALYNRGVIHYQVGKIEEAIADYTSLIELSEAPVEEITKALCNRGILHFESGRMEEEVRDYTRVIQLPKVPINQLAVALYNRGTTLAEVGRYEDALNDFGILFSIKDQKLISEIVTPRLQHVLQRVVESIFSHTTDPQRWSARITEFLPHFSRYNGLPQLGDALVQHLPKLAGSPLNHAAYDAWGDAWSQGCAALSQEEQDHLEIPLRLLRTGIEYLKAKDETKLLVLASEERKLLRQALQLPPEV